MSGAQKGDTVRWYETLSRPSNKSTYSVKPENLNLEKYKRILLSKLNDILAIIGFDIHCLRSQLLNHNEVICDKNYSYNKRIQCNDLHK